MVSSIPVSDSVILDKIRKNNLKGWEELYDQHAALMLSIICQLTGDREKGEEILVDLFTSHKFRQYVLAIHSKLKFHLCTFVFTHTVKAMSEEGMEPDALTISRLPKILQFLYKRNKAENDIADTASGWKLSGPVYKSIYAYHWLPVFGISI